MQSHWKFNEQMRQYNQLPFYKRWGTSAPKDPNPQLSQTLGMHAYHRQLAQNTNRYGWYDPRRYLNAPKMPGVAQGKLPPPVWSAPGGGSIPSPGSAYQGLVRSGEGVFALGTLGELGRRLYSSNSGDAQESSPTAIPQPDGRDSAGTASLDTAAGAESPGGWRQFLGQHGQEIGLPMMLLGLLSAAGGGGGWLLPLLLAGGGGFLASGGAGTAGQPAASSGGKAPSWQQMIAAIDPKADPAAQAEAQQSLSSGLGGVQGWVARNFGGLGRQIAPDMTRNMFHGGIVSRIMEQTGMTQQEAEEYLRRRMAAAHPG